MINGGPGFQIPSSSLSQSASDRLPLKVASAIAAHTCRLFLPTAQEERRLGAKLRSQHKGSEMVRPAGRESGITTSQPIRESRHESSNLRHSAVLLTSIQPSLTS